MASAPRNVDLLRETVAARGFRGFRAPGFTCAKILQDGVRQWTLLLIIFAIVQGIVSTRVSPKSQNYSKLWDPYICNCLWFLARFHDLQSAFGCMHYNSRRHRKFVWVWIICRYVTCYMGHGQTWLKCLEEDGHISIISYDIPEDPPKFIKFKRCWLADTHHSWLIAEAASGSRTRPIFFRRSFDPTLRLLGKLSSTRLYPLGI